ncbi:MAG: putative porin, partial [Ferruginibacter sp.]
ISNDALLLNPNNKDRFSIDVNIGNSSKFVSNPFSTAIKTGNINKDFTFFFRHSYDLGKKDSIIINDSTTEYVFFPKLRIQHSFSYSTYSYSFLDIAADSLIYKTWYNVYLPSPIDTFSLKEKWNVTSNDLSLIQFPDTRNAAQFFLAGITMQNIKGEFTSGISIFYNMILHGEYRNRTRNKKWDVLLKGEFYVSGRNSGDYSVSASLDRYLNKKLGNVHLFFNNVNRSPSFIFSKRSSFNLGTSHDNKENIISFGASSTNRILNVGFKNHLVTNYSYFTNYYQSDYYNKVINILQLFASKKLRITKHWNWYIEAVLQQTDGAAPVKVPLLFTRNRLAYEGRFYKNLNISAGLEARYYSPYKANNYSPVISQFVPQDTVTISNLPDVTAFLHFRIKNFTAFVRAENLNTVSGKNGFAFINNNFAAPHYPTQGFMLRLGIQWWFVN